jgi:hypothetical protein
MSTVNKEEEAIKKIFGGKWGQTDTWQGALAGSLGSAGGSLANTLLGQGRTDNIGGKIGSGISNIGSAVGSALSAVNPLLGGAVSLASGLLGGGLTALVGADFNEENIADIENQNTINKNTTVASGSFQNIADQWKNQSWGREFTKDDIGEEGIWSNSVSKKFNSLKKETYQADRQLLANYDNAIDNTGRQISMAERANIFARGGNLDRGSMTHGGIFDNGVIFVNNGGEHGNNPYGGVPMGRDQQGVLNLVEEGEVVYNNFVYSGMKAPKTIRKKYSMRGAKDTYADIAKKLAKESEERPNDPISKRGLEANLIQLAIDQESMKKKKNSNNRQSNIFDDGGPLLRYTISLPDIGDSEYTDDDFIMSHVPGRKEAPKSTFAGHLGDDADKVSKTKRNGYNIFGDVDGSILRYISPIGNSIAGIIQNVLTPNDYSHADRIERAATSLATPTRVSHTPFGDYMKVEHIDPNSVTNKLAAESAALRNTLRNTSSASRNAALLAADRAAQDASGDALMKVAEQNLARDKETLTHNNSVKQANAELGLRAAMANADMEQRGKASAFQGILQATAMRKAIDDASNQALTSNINSLWSTLGSIGQEEAIKKMIQSDRYAYVNGKPVYIGENTSKFGMPEETTVIPMVTTAPAVKKASDTSVTPVAEKSEDTGTPVITTNVTDTGTTVTPAPTEQSTDTDATTITYTSKDLLGDTPIQDIPADHFKRSTNYLHNTTLKKINIEADSIPGPAMFALEVIGAQVGDGHLKDAINADKDGFRSVISGGDTQKIVEHILKNTRQKGGVKLAVRKINERLKAKGLPEITLPQ